MISSEKQNKISAVIPFFNEVQNLHNVVEKVLNYVDIIILVDDGSTDGSKFTIPDDSKIILIEHPKNYGKGRALYNGILKSIELKTDITVTLDADYQHDPSLIPTFVENMDKYDIIIGSRDQTNTEMPLHRKLSNYLTSKLLSIKTGERIIDSQSGFRALKTEISSKILPEFDGFEAESEMIVKACRNRLKIGYVQIPTIYGNDYSKMKAIPTIVGFIKVLLKG